MKVSELMLLLSGMPKSNDVEFEVASSRYPVRRVKQKFRDKPDYKWVVVMECER